MNDNVVMIFVPGKAVPQGSKTAFISKSTGRPIVVDKDVRLPQWRSTVTSHALGRLKAYDHVDTIRPFDVPMLGPVAVSITFVMERPRSHYGTGKNAEKIKASSPRFPATMPDIDKLIRAILDGLTDAQVWRDDGQVVWLQAAKRYADSTPLRGPGVHITIGEML